MTLLNCLMCAFFLILAPTGNFSLIMMLGAMIPFFVDGTLSVANLATALFNGDQRALESETNEFQNHSEPINPNE